MPRRLPTLAALLLLAAPAAADVKIDPPAVALRHAADSQQLVVTDFAAGRTVVDLSPVATFTSANPAVARVDAAGRVTAVADGETTVTAAAGGKTATVPVKVSGTAKPFQWGFKTHVEPTLTRTGCNSGACHGALAGKGGFKLSLRGFDPDADHFVITRQAVARRLDQGNPANSLLLTKPTRVLPHGGGERFTEDSPHYRVLSEWVRAGAGGPSEAEPALVRIELFPAPARLKPKDTLRVIVRGHYADGTTADVTPWVKFTSTADLVAAVDDDGKVTVGGPGEAAVVANVANRVATLAVTVPFPAPVPPRPAGKNVIDTHVNDKLSELRIPASADATDAEFVRRAYLDACGVLPKPAEVTAFLADPRPDRRAMLIDALLDRPEYVDYWAHKWSDLLLVSTRKLPQPAVWAFYRHVRRAVADNTPWDAFARGIVTASGSTLENGPANYFVMHKDVSDLVESTAVTFLGTAINCAKCHNHPLEKWTQDQYWATANLFGRVGLKNGDRPGEVIVQPLPAGDAFHLRRGTAMPPAPLDGKPMPADGPADRREFFADWLTSPANPFFAKALANRVWKTFMGRGLVDPEDDLRESNPPSHPALLDALAADFVAHKYDVKHLVRVVMNSAAYQRSSKPVPGNETDDRFYSHYLVRRLAAEVILDAYSDVTGVPTPFDKLQVGASGGTVGTASFPPGTRAVQLPDSLLVSQFLDSFGRAERGQTCACEKTTDASVAQALHLNNGQTLNDKLKNPLSRASAVAAAKTADADVIRDLYAAALMRPPTAAEAAKFAAVLADAPTPQARREAVEDLFWAVLTSREFLFNR